MTNLEIREAVVAQHLTRCLREDPDANNLDDWSLLVHTQHRYPEAQAAIDGLTGLQAGRAIQKARQWFTDRYRPTP